MSTKLRGLFVFCGLLLGGILFAQEKTVTGTVTDANGFALPDVSVRSSSGEEVFTDMEGNYSIQASQGEVLTIELLGLEIVTVTVGAGNTYNATLRDSGAIELEGAVVTAMGITREKKSLGYASQQLDGEQVNSTPTNNFLNNLSGKVAGMEIRANNNFGGSTNVILRGNKSLTRNNQALIVVDGVPINSGNLNNTDAARGRDGIDFGNGTSDIDPNNIESINVLKGASATVLYGSMASNGAVIITTKKGKKNQDLGITLNSTVSVGSIDKKTFPGYQKKYGQGYAGEDSFYIEDVNGDGIDDFLAATLDDASYGAAFDPSLLVYQWNAFLPENANFGLPTPWVAAKNDPSEFFNKSIAFVNSLNLNGGDENSAYNVSFTNNYETGIMPNSRLNKNIISGNYTREFSDNFQVTTFLNFTDQTTIGRNTVGYGDNIITGFRQWWPINVDIKELRNEYFRHNQNATWNMSSPTEGILTGEYWNNPYWDRYQNFSTDDRTRILTGVTLSYDITKDLNLMGRATIDYLNSKRDIRKAVGSHAEEFGVAQADETSGYWVWTDRIMMQTYDLIATYDWDISDSFGANFLAGATFTDTHNESTENSTTGGLIIPGLYTVENSVDYFPGITHDITGQKSGIYAQASFDYNNLLFLEGTVRRDESIALHFNNREYVYYSAGTSFVFSELIKGNWLNFGKIRASYAKVGNDLPAGLLGYFTNNGVINGYPMADISNTYVNWETLKPEEQNSIELGLEASLFKKRVNLDVSVYKLNTKNLLYDVPQSPSTQYVYSLINAGETENKGIEVSLNLIPIRTNDFEWSMNINWAKNENIVVSLDEGRDNLQLATFQHSSLNATVGEAYGTFRGTGYTYNENGDRLVDEDGYYIIAQDQVIGNIQPDWVGGIYNTFRYKNLSFGFLIDIKKGGDVYSLDQDYGGYSGIYGYTAGLNDLGNPIRNSLENGGGIILPGVMEDPDNPGTYIQNDVRLDASFAGGVFGSDGAYPMEEFIYDASYVKLREAKLSYTLPEKLLRSTFVKGATFSVLGNNLWIIHKNLPDADPEAGTSSGNIQGFQSGVMPTTRVISFNVKLNF